MNSRQRVLAGGTIYPDASSEPIRNGVVLIDGGVIATVGASDVPVPAAAEVVDCSGFTLFPGFWNSHVHFFERKWANATTIPRLELTRQLHDTFSRYGFTTVFDTGSSCENTLALRQRIDSGDGAGPSILTTGEGLVPPGAMPSQQVLAAMGIAPFGAPELSDAAEAARAARSLLDRGVDGIKLFASAPRGAALPEPAMRAATEEAHAANRPVFVHPNSGADVLMSLRCGVDIVAHTTPHSGPWDHAILEAAAERRAALTPTLSLWRFFSRHDRVSSQEQTVATAVAQLRSWIAAGAVVLFGTDLGAVDSDPLEEYLLMTEAGMTPRQILASLTTAPAERFGRSGLLGRIDRGFRADVTVLKNDPLADLRSLTEVAYTIKAGEIVYRAHGMGMM